MSSPEHIRDVQETPFYLKRMGDFSGALKGYAHQFATAEETGNRFLSRECFEEIFDLYLLQYFKEQSRFQSMDQLRRRLQTDMRELLTAPERLDEKSFQPWFDSCWRRFTPRGRGQSPYSVDKRLLVPQ